MNFYQRTFLEKLLTKLIIYIKRFSRKAVFEQWNRQKTKFNERLYRKQNGIFLQVTLFFMIFLHHLQSISLIAVLLTSEFKICWYFR